MSALVILDLPMDVSTDFFADVTLNGQTATQLSFVGSTAELLVRATELDTTPLFTVTTTAGANGSLAFGIALPPPVGAVCTNQAEIDNLGLPLEYTLTPPGPILTTQTSTANLATFLTTGLVSGTVAFVTAGNGGWFFWSPGDTNTPNGTTIIATTSAGPAGNWLLAPTITIAITEAATALLAGLDIAWYDLLVTLPNATTLKLFSGRIPVAPTA